MTTWNPADTSSRVTLSGGDLVAARNSTDATFYGSGRSTTSKSSGLVYFESQFTERQSAPGAAAAIGLAQAGADINNYFGIAGGLSIAYYSDGSVFLDDVVITTLATYDAGDVLQCALNQTTGKAWFGKNNNWNGGDPAAGTGEHYTFTAGATFFAGFSLYAFAVGNTDKATARFSAAQQTYSAPSGFSAWDATTVTTANTYTSPSGGKSGLSVERVRAKYEELEHIERQIQAKEEAERERIRKIEEEKRTLAELEEKKRQTKTIAERRRKISERIARQEEELRNIRIMMADLMEQIERVRAEVELQQTIADRRRRMVLLLAAAA